MFAFLGALKKAWDPVTNEAIESHNTLFVSADQLAQGTSEQNVHPYVRD